jgi:microcystin-dependent protein
LAAVLSEIGITTGREHRQEFALAAAPGDVPDQARPGKKCRCARGIVAVTWRYLFLRLKRPLR